MLFAVTLKSALGNQPTSHIVIDIVLSLLLGVAGFRLSQRTRLIRGVTPWRIPSAVWAIICFFFSAFGIVLEMIAVYFTRSIEASAAKNPAAYSPTGATPISVPLAASAPATEDAGAMWVPTVPASGMEGPTSDITGQPALFGWYPDVVKRHEERYWDGRDWTSFVRDAGESSEDPLAR